MLIGLILGRRITPEAKQHALHATYTLCFGRAYWAADFEVIGRCRTSLHLTDRVSIDTRSSLPLGMLDDEGLALGLAHHNIFWLGDSSRGPLVSVGADNNLILKGIGRDA
jgi:hypothetical protein